MIRRIKFLSYNKYLRGFFEWFWFRKEERYKAKKYPLKIIRIYTWRSFLMDNYPNLGSRAGVAKILPWEEGYVKRM